MIDLATNTNQANTLNDLCSNLYSIDDFPNSSNLKNKSLMTKKKKKNDQESKIN